MIYVTGDTHADFRRFSTREFPEQKELTKDDFVIICGDFGLKVCHLRHCLWTEIMKTLIALILASLNRLTFMVDGRTGSETASSI